MTVQRIFGLFLLAVLALFAYALKEGLPNDHQISGIVWYTLSVLGFISNLFGMGYTMGGAVIVTMGYLMLVAIFGLWMLSTPQPAYSESYATMMRRYPTASLGVKIAVPAIYLLGAIACSGIVWIIWL